MMDNIVRVSDNISGGYRTDMGTEWAKGHGGDIGSLADIILVARMAGNIWSNIWSGNVLWFILCIL